MLPPIERITVSAFDLHLWPGPLTDRNILSAPVRVLCDPSDYRAARVAGTKLELHDFWVFPLSRELLPKGNHFWQRYAIAASLLGSGGGNGGPDARDWLLPMRCRPHQWPLDFAATPAMTVTAHATVWLWPFGWASSVEFGFRPQKAITIDDARAITASLSSGGGALPFTLAGRAVRLSDIFKTLRETIKTNLAAADPLIGDVPKVWRRVVVAVVLSPGSPLPAYRAASPGSPPFSDSERGRVLGVLTGKELDARGVVALEKSSTMQVTPLPGGSLALSRADCGTLLVMRHPSDARSRRDRYRCFFANIRACWIASSALGELIKYYDDNNTALASLVSAATGTLKRLPANYTHDLCRVITGYQAPASS